MTEWVEYADDNGSVGASGGYYPPDTRTEEEKQQQERDEIAAAVLRSNEERAANLEIHPRLLASTNPAIQAIARLHGPVVKSYYRDPVCDGCDMDGYECEPPEWPCRTWNVVAMLQREEDS